MVISIEGGPTSEEMDLARTKPTKSKPNTTDTGNSENTNIENNDESGVQHNEVSKNSQENIIQGSINEEIEINDEVLEEMDKPFENKDELIALAKKKIEEFNSYFIGVSAIHPELNPQDWPAPLGDNVAKP